MDRGRIEQTREVQFGETPKGKEGGMGKRKKLGAWSCLHTVFFISSQALSVTVTDTN